MNEPKAPELPTEAPPKPKDPDMLAKAIERTQQAGLGNGGEMIKRRTVTFDIDCEVCSPGLFTDDLSITLQTLTAGEEMKSSRGLTDGPEIVSAMARDSILAVNGSKITSVQREFLWEALGPGGRQLVLLMHNENGSATNAALGKARASSTKS